MLKFLAGVVTVLATAAAASAADLPNGVASPGLMRGDSAYNWSGVYAGVSGGMGWAELSDARVTRSIGKMKNDGFVGGLQAGFNRQVGRFVVGLEGDFSLSNSSGDVTGGGLYGAFTIAPSAARVESSVIHIGTVRARMGYAFDNVLLYATGGYAYSRQRLNFTGDFTTTPGGHTAAKAGATSNNMNGWAVGAGLEYAVIRGTSLKFEYLYLQFNESAFFGGSWAETRASSQINLFRAGVNFRI